MREPISNASIANGLYWCIAGGFAACPTLAADQDVWVFIDPFDDVDDVADTIRIRLMLRGVGYYPEYNAARSDRYGATGEVQIGKVATLLDGRHILTTNANDIHALLDTFDVSTHQVALTSDGELIKGRRWTPITEPPVQLRDTPTTAARMQKIRERYRSFVDTQWSPADDLHGVGGTVSAL